MQLAICDNNAFDLARLADLLELYKQQKKCSFTVDLFENSLELLEHIALTRYNVLFLNVLMPDVNGLQIAQRVRRFDQTIKIIFIACSPDFALQSYSVEAYSYLLKPLAADQIFPLMDRLFETLYPSKKELLFCRQSSIQRIFSEDLEYVEVLRKQLFFHLANGSVRQITGTLAEVTAQLIDRSEFIKVHRSYLVNMARVQELRKLEFVMLSGAVVPISRPCYMEVKRLYVEYLFSGDIAYL